MLRMVQVLWVLLCWFRGWFQYERNIMYSLQVVCSGLTSFQRSTDFAKHLVGSADPLTDLYYFRQARLRFLDHI